MNFTDVINLATPVDKENFKWISSKIELPKQRGTYLGWCYRRIEPGVHWHGIATVSFDPMRGWQSCMDENKDICVIKWMEYPCEVIYNDN